MKHAFCTLFDSSYFSRGLAMYESLANHCENFELYILALDCACYRALKELDLPNVIPISLDEFEDENLLKIKPTRSRAEYCWTCTPSIILYVLEKYEVHVCTYLDADIFFFDSPGPLLAELKENAVIITEHRYTKGHDQTAVSGKYNVQFMTFRNNAYGLNVLRWWRSACLESCEFNPKEGKCGDQKYLDDWLTRFEKIHVLENLGGGIAPWNVQQYYIGQCHGRVIGREIETGVEFALVFFHFHGFKLTKSGRVRLTGLGYPISKEVVTHIYVPYIFQLEEAEIRLKEKGIEFDPHGLISDEKIILPKLQNWRTKFVRLFGCACVHDNYNAEYKISDLKKRFCSSGAAAR